MTPTDVIPPLVEQAAPVVVAVVGLVAAAHIFGRSLPFRFPVRLVAAGVGLLLTGAAIKASVEQSPAAAMGGSLVLGLVVFLVRRWRSSAEARERQADRLRQARGHERRRGAVPLPPGGGASP